MNRIPHILLIALLGFGCSNESEVLIPTLGDGGFLAEARPLTPEQKARMDGIYSVTAGSDRFGTSVVLKWAGDNLSIFTGVDVGQFVLLGGHLDTVLVFQGYWRKLVNEETGIVQFYVAREEGGRFVLGDTTGSPGTAIRMQGGYGDGSAVPSVPLVLEFQRAIAPELLTGDFHILAHRAGGRTSDYLPASENTVEMIRIAEAYGATGIEIDVRLTKDGVPVLYHDASLNPRSHTENPTGRGS